MKNEQVFEKLALDKEITKKIFGGLLDDSNKCADQSMETCGSVVKYQSVKCKLGNVEVQTYCAHPNETEAAAVHPTAWTIPHYYCYEPVA